MTTTKCRKARPRNKGFESISRDMLQDKRLSLKARGLLGMLQSLPDDWECNGVEGLVKDFCDHDGFVAVNNAIKELEEAGLFARLKRQGAAKRWCWLWTYSHDPRDVAAEVAEWVAQGYSKASCSGPKDQKTPRQRKEEQERLADEATLLTKPQHGEGDTTMLRKPVHGSPVSGQPQHKEVYSEVDSPGSFQKNSPTETSSGRDQRGRDASPAAQTTATQAPSGDLFTQTQDQDPVEPDGCQEQDQGRHGGDQLPVPASEQPPPFTGATVVGWWVDHYRETFDQEPTVGQKGQVGRYAGQMIKAGWNHAKIMYAAKEAAIKGYANIDEEYRQLAVRAQGRWVNGSVAKPSTTNQRVNQALDLAAYYEAIESQQVV